MSNRPGSWKSGKQPSQRQGWRKGTSDAAAGGRSYHWLRRTGQKRPVMRRVIRWGITALAALLIVVFIRYLLYFPVKTPLIVAAVTDYAAPFPPNAWAREDLDRFAQTWPSSAQGWFRLTQDDSVLVTEIDEPWQSESNAIGSLRQSLRSSKARPGGPDKDVVMIYVSAHGMLDGDGQPCLLLGGAAREVHAGTRLLPASHCLKLSSLLQEIGQSLPSTVKKVLILDANRIDANWPLGILYNGFADQLPAAVREAKVDNLYVLNSTDLRQRSRGAPQLQASPFAHFLASGLQYQSDRNGDGVVTLQELCDDLHARVDDWTIHEWHQSQQPMLVASDTAAPAASVKLTWAKGAGGRKDTSTVAAPSTIDQAALAELWLAHARLNPWPDLGPGNRSPSPAAEAQRRRTRRQLALWEAFQQGLLRLEQVSRAGSAYQDEARQLAASLSAVAAELTEGPPTDGSVAFSLPLAEWLASPPSETEVAAARQWLEKPPPPEVPLVAGREACAVAAWSWVLAGADAGRINRALELLALSGSAPAPIFTELHFARVLSATLGLLPEAVAGDTSLLRTALECRRDAEAAASAACDERVAYFIREQVDEADQLRRQAEDRLFVGNPGDLTVARQRFQQASRGYAAATERAAALAKAFDARDRGWSHLPYLAAWIARRPEHPQFAVDGPGDQLVLLDQTLANHGQLADRLEAISQARSAPLAGQAPDEALRRLAAAVEGGIRQLEFLYDDAVTREFKRAADGQNLREIDELLSAPLLTGDRRVELLNVMNARLSRGRPVTEGVDRTAAERSATGTPTYWWWHSHPHPAAQLLGLAAEPAGEGQPREPTEPELRRTVLRLAALGEKVRGTIDGVPATIGQLQAARDDDSDAGAAAVHERRSRAVRLARAGLPFLPLVNQRHPESALLHNAFRSLERLDRQRLMMWQAERTLEDFWGPDESDPEQTYFAAVSGAYLRAAAALEPDLSVKPRHELETRRKQLMEAAPQAVETAIAPVRLLDGSSEVRVRTEVSSAAAAPAGVAAIWAVDASGETAPAALNQNADVWLDRLEIALGGKPQSWELRLTPRQSSAGGLDDINGDWRLVRLYRAHRGAAPFSVAPALVTREIVWEHERVVLPTLTVEGEADKPGAIAFVLDCSGSMSKKELAPDRTERTRMQIALMALREMLERLAVSGKYEVSIWLYGHRRGDDAKGGTPWNSNNPYTQPEDPLVLPSDDVQLYVPRTLLTRDSMEEIRPRLKDTFILPYGLTPLYLAMTRALEEDLANAPATSPRRLIVITDGNDNTTPNRGARWQPKREALRTASDVIRTYQAVARAQGAPVYLNLVGCGVEDQKPLNAIADSAGPLATYHNLSDGVSRLAAELEATLGLYEVEVAPTGDARGDRRPQRFMLGEHHEFSQPRGREEYAVRLPALQSVDPGRLAVEGGEQLVMRLEAIGTRQTLIHPRYQFQGQRLDQQTVMGHPRANPADPDFDPPEFVVTALRPRRDGGVIPFRLAVQNGDRRRFSPRPAEYWVEITPIAADDRGGPQRLEPYVFYDASFVAAPAPVLSCPARNWPPEADSAEIELFFKLFPTPATRRVLLADISRGEHPDDQLELRLKSGERVRFALTIAEVEGQTNTWQVDVAEIHSGGEGGLAGVKVAWSHGAGRAVRRFYAGDGRIQHSFLFPGVRREQLDNYELCLTTREALEENAARLEQPIRVPVATGL